MVNAAKVLVMRECARGSLAGELTFPEVVGRLAAIGVERYHAYSRQEITYYLAAGDSQVASAPHEPHATATEFDPSAVGAAVRQKSTASLQRTRTGDYLIERSLHPDRVVARGPARAASATRQCGFAIARSRAGFVVARIACEYAGAS
jgi:hypothetical protein